MLVDIWHSTPPSIHGFKDLIVPSYVAASQWFRRMRLAILIQRIIWGTCPSSTPVNFSHFNLQNCTGQLKPLDGLPQSLCGKSQQKDIWSSLMYCFWDKNEKTGEGEGYSVHFQQYFSYIVAVSFIGGGNRGKPPTCRKSLPNFITPSMLHRVHLAWAGFTLTTLVVICTDCIGATSKVITFYSKFDIYGSFNRKKHSVIYSNIVVTIADSEILRGQNNFFILNSCFNSV
jgi:hypothetical protein